MYSFCVVIIALVYNNKQKTLKFWYFPSKKKEANGERIGAAVKAGLVRFSRPH